MQSNRLKTNPNSLSNIKIVGEALPTKVHVSRFRRIEFIEITFHVSRANAYQLLSVFILTGMVLAANASAQLQRGSEDVPPARRQQVEVYQESAWRRFEVVTLIALPFTSIHSFLGVRGVEMLRQNKVAPELSNTDFKIIGASAVSLALFIGFWDWLHTHGKNPSQQLIPNSPTPFVQGLNPQTTPPSEAAKVLKDNPPLDPRGLEKGGLTSKWEFKDSPDFVIQLVQFRF